MPICDRSGSPQWLDICRHRIRRQSVPYVVVIQHHLVPAVSRIVAPVVPAGGRPATLLAPRLDIGRVAHRAVLLEMSAVLLGMIGEVVGSALADSDAIGDALDAIFRGYPVGLPI
ncbi:MAG: CcdB family protein [Rhodospirillales bacterium]|nr:CcdB family protein [Rhodospirillales bacterium]